MGPLPGSGSSAVSMSSAPLINPSSGSRSSSSFAGPVPAVDDVVYLSPPALGPPALAAGRFPIAVGLNPPVCSRGDQTSRNVHWHSSIVTEYDRTS